MPLSQGVVKLAFRCKPTAKPIFKIRKEDVKEDVSMTCEGKVAIATGAAGSGMGRSIALTLAREGAKIIVNYRRARRAPRRLLTTSRVVAAVQSP